MEMGCLLGQRRRTNYLNNCQLFYNLVFVLVVVFRICITNSICNSICICTCISICICTSIAPITLTTADCSTKPSQNQLQPFVASLKAGCARKIISDWLFTLSVHKLTTLDLYQQQPALQNTLSILLHAEHIARLRRLHKEFIDMSKCTKHILI